MTTTPNNNVSKPSSSQYNAFRVDMFGRTKVSNGETIFDSQHRYKASGDYSDEIVGAQSGVTYNSYQSAELLTCGTASGDKVTRESKRVFPYQPGKSLQVMQTFVFAPAKTNLRQRAGYFSRTNGVYLELSGTQLAFVLRSYVTGQLVETRVLQSEWNMDKLDGNGPSDVVLDITKAQILFSEYEWLGVGSVRVGFAIDGVFIVVHQFNHANHIDVTYMTTASLPIRYEIENLGTTSSSSSMKQICATVISNGGYTRRTESWTAARSTTVNVSSDFYPLVSIRLASGRTDSVIIPSGLSILPIAQGNYEWALIKNATITGGTWTNHTPSTGNVDYNITATAMTGGTQVYEGFLSASNQANTSVSLDSNLLRWDLQLGRTNADTPVSDTLTLAIRSLGGTQSAIGSIQWSDFL
jgi:hypothetical protein